MIKAIVFDWYNVCTTEGWTSRTVREISLKYGLSEDKARSVMKELFPRLVTGRIEEEDYLEELSQKIGVIIGKEIFQSLPPLNEGTLNLVKELRRDYITVLFTGNFKPVFENYKKKINLQEYFDHLFLSYEYGRRKNDPKMWDIILKETKLNPEEILFVDDNTEYLGVARNKGIPVILFDENWLEAISYHIPLPANR